MKNEAAVIGSDGLLADVCSRDAELVRLQVRKGRDLLYL
jgi:hypothetical protein